jgi:5-methylcytosine-specific restriction endonuclease McrA
MTRRSVSGSKYPDNWKEISRRVKEAAEWKCVRCGHPHDPASGHTLTTHHLDLDPGNNAWWNTLALCQRCHLSIQARVVLHRPYVMAPHTPWFRPYVAGYYAKWYLGLDLTRDEVETRLVELLDLERHAVLGLAP